MTFGCRLIAINFAVLGALLFNCALGCAIGHGKAINRNLELMITCDKQEIVSIDETPSFVLRIKNHSNRTLVIPKQTLMPGSQAHIAASRSPAKAGSYVKSELRRGPSHQEPFGGWEDIETTSLPPGESFIVYSSQFPMIYYIEDDLLVEDHEAGEWYVAGGVELILRQTSEQYGKRVNLISKPMKIWITDDREEPVNTDGA